MTTDHATFSLLRSARRLIEKPESWTKGAFGRDQGSLAVDCVCPTAVCFCSVGALERAASSFSQGQADSLVFSARQILQRQCGCNLVAFNDDDSTDHKDVLKLFDDAIALEPAK